MSLRTDLLSVVDQARALSGPLGVDIRLHQVTVKVRSWTGGRKGSGISIDSEFPLAQQYPVRTVKQEEIAASGGQYQVGDVLVDHITPGYGTGGYTPQQLKPPMALGDRQERIYRLIGPHAGEYALVEIRTFRPFTYQLVLRRRVTTPTETIESFTDGFNMLSPVTILNVPVSNVSPNDVSQTILSGGFFPQSLTLQVTGIFVATYLLEGSLDGLSWVDLTPSIFNVHSNGFAATITAPGLYQVTFCPQPFTRVRCTSYTSGTPVMSVSGQT